MQDTIKRSKFYPWKLNDKETLKLLSLFPKTTFGDGTSECNNYLEIFVKSGLAKKCGIRQYYIEHPETGNKLAFQKLKFLITKLSCHPSLITDEMKEVIANSDMLQQGMRRKALVLTPGITKLVPAGDGQMQVVIEPASDTISPLVRIEAVKTDILENLIDKMQAMLSAMGTEKIRRASLGTLSKSFENLMKGYTMFKGEASSKSYLQVNIGTLNLQQKKELSLKTAK